MGIESPLFEGKLIRLTALDPEKDAEVESKWTQDMDYLRLLGEGLARPLAPSQVKKQYQSIEKDMEERGNLFHFAIRPHLAGEASDRNRLIGFARLYAVEWNNGAGMLKLGIGERGDRRQGYGSEALRLCLRYAFRELNLYRLAAVVPEYNQAAIRFFARAGFVEEVRRREALNRDGRYWDMLHLGILQPGWEAKWASEP